MSSSPTALELEVELEGRKTHFYVEQTGRAACGVDRRRRLAYADDDGAVTCKLCRAWLDRKPRARRTPTRGKTTVSRAFVLDRQHNAALDALHALDATPYAEMAREAFTLWLADRYRRGPGAVRATIRKALGRVPEGAAADDDDPPP